MNLKAILILPISTLLLAAGCGGNEAGAVDGSDPNAFTPNYDDVVMSADAPENKPPPVEASPEAPPPDGLVAAPDPDAAMLERMTPRERAEYEEKIKPVKEAAAAEEASNSVLLGDLQHAVEEYHYDNGKLPPNLAALVKGGYMTYIPRIPAGKTVRIDGKTMQVTIE